MNFSLLNLQCHGDENGWLISLEALKNVPFDIKRVYYIYATKKDFVRGKHAHRALEQYIVCVNGSCVFYLDDGIKKEKVCLDSPEKALYIKNNVWREFSNFSEDCVIIVLANSLYDKNDYINDYEVFLREVKSGKTHKR